MRTQATALGAQARTAPSPLRDAAIDSLIARLNVLEKALSPAFEPGPGFLEPLNIGLGIAGEISYLLRQVDGSSGPVTSGERLRATELEVQWVDLRSRVDRVLAADLQRVNNLAASTGLAGRIVRKPTRPRTPPP